MTWDSFLPWSTVLGSVLEIAAAGNVHSGGVLVVLLVALCFEGLIFSGE